MTSFRARVSGDETATASSDRHLVLLGIAGLMAGLAVVADPEFQPVLLGAAIGFTGLLVLASWKSLRQTRGKHKRPATLEATLERLPEAAIITDGAGLCVMQNALAERSAFGGRGARIQTALSRVSADPDRAVSLLLSRARSDGVAEDRFGMETATVAKVISLPGDTFLWRMHEAGNDPNLAILSFAAEGPHMNAAAAKLFGTDDVALTDLILDLPLRQAGHHQVRLASGEVTSMRVVRLFEFGDYAEYGFLPDAPSSGATSPSDVAPAVPDLLSVLPVPMLKVKEDGTLLEVNAEARTILALDDTSLPPLFELVEGMGRSISDWLGDAAGGRGLLKPEIVRAVVPGQELYLQITLGRTMEQGEIVLVGILNDATELKTLEAQFVQSQKMQAIGQLAGGIAHDFNNLLTAISGHCDLLLLRHDAGDPDYSDLIQISQNSNRAASLVGQLLAFSRKQNLKPQVLDLRDTMVDLAHLLNRLIGERIQLNVTHAPGPQTIRADRRQLEQVIVNLVVNARDAMPDGGKIAVQTRREYLSEETSRDRARLLPGEYVVIEVADSGSGIPPEALSKIFEPFYTTKKTGEGTGLGLSTAYGIVKQTGGFIFVESKIGEGTTFSLYFPAAADGKVEDVVELKPTIAAPTKRVDAVILLVEDEAPVRAFASRALRLRGYTVLEAADAEEALSILEDKALSVDLFVSDVIMPGMDGPTWVRQALKDRPETGVVFMSGYAEEGRAEKQARIPNSDFLPKPFSLQQLTSLVQEKLH